jgi:hypothetical protein
MNIKKNLRAGKTETDKRTEIPTEEWMIGWAGG